MSIPKYNEIMSPLLDYLSNKGEKNFRSLEQPLAVHFNLSTEEIAKIYDSGNGRVFLDRISWALSYLTVAKLTERPKRGYYQNTDLAAGYLNNPEKVQQFVKQRSAERDEQRRLDKALANDVAPELLSDDRQQITPQEQLDVAYNSILQSTYDTIIDTILSKTPTEFEKLVVMLLEKMGYGGQIENAGQVTQASNDGGIDGIIKEDVLGLGTIHLQAKRYNTSNSVGREEIQKFVGAIAVAQSNKGVFITTSKYTKGAIEYAANLNGSTNLVLIDGEKLAEYIYKYNLGMHSKQTIVIKELDSDFWDTMQEGK